MSIPKKYTLEAQDERTQKAKLKNPKSRYRWGYSDISERRWEEIFGKKSGDKWKK